MVITTTTIRLKTAARYQGLEVTILGNVDAGRLLAIAGYGTHHELAIAAIGVKRRRGARVYCVIGGSSWTSSIDDVAQAAVRTRETRDASR